MASLEGECLWRAIVNSTFPDTAEFQPGNFPDFPELGHHRLDDMTQ